MEQREIMEKIRQVSDYLQDDQSKEILELRRQFHYEGKEGLLPKLMELSSDLCRTYGQNYSYQHSHCYLYFKENENPIVFMALEEMPLFFLIALQLS